MLSESCDTFFPIIFIYATSLGLCKREVCVVATSCATVYIGILQEMRLDDENNVTVMACLILLLSPENLSLFDNLEELK